MELTQGCERCGGGERGFKGLVWRRKAEGVSMHVDGGVAAVAEAREERVEGKAVQEGVWGIQPRHDVGIRSTDQSTHHMRRKLH